MSKGMSVKEFKDYADRRFRSMERAGKKVTRDVISVNQIVDNG